MRVISKSTIRGGLAARFAATVAGAAGLSLLFGAGAASAAPGFLNTSFANGGTLITQLGTGSAPMSFGGGVAVTSSGDSYQVGAASTVPGNIALYITRRLPNGTLDASFGNGGIVYENVGVGSPAETAIPSGTFMAPALVALAANGDPVVLTDATTASGTDLTVLEFTSTGQLNTSFASGGVYELTVGGSATLPGGLAVEDNGDIVFTGSFLNSSSNQQFVAGRLTSDGQVDSGFGSGGLFEPSFGSASNSIAAGVIAQADGDLIFTAFTDGGSPQIAVIRSTPSGQLDNSFGSGGIVYLSAVAPIPVLGLVQTSDGGYAVASAVQPASSQLQASVTRLTSNGQIDTGFGTGGTALLPTSALPVGIGTDLFVQPDGRLIVTGIGSGPGGLAPEPFAARLNADGSMDNGFGVDGVSLNPVAPTPGALSYPTGAAETADGNMLFSGVVEAATAPSAFLQEVNLDTAPTVSFVYAPMSVLTGTPVQFDASATSSTDEPVGSVSWDFGSGSFGAATGTSVAHTFTTPGTYTVRAKVADAFGLSTTSTQTITVTAAPVTGTTSTPTVTPAQVLAPTLKLVSLTSSHGKVKVTFLCAFAACKVSGTLTTHAHIRKGKTASLSAGGHGRSVTVASTTLSISVNQIHTFTIKLNKAGRKLLAKFGKVPASGSFKLTNATRAKTIRHKVTVH
jgi:uncharacterized delta-60 repeat protein